MIFQHVIEIVRVLAWPAAAVTLAILLRDKIGIITQGRLSRIKAGNIELEFDKDVDEAASSIEKAVAGSSSAERQTLPLRLRELALNHPVGAVLAAAREVEVALLEHLESSGVDVGKLRNRGSLRLLAEEAFRAKAITSDTSEALATISRTRNRLAHTREDLSPERALQFISIVDAVMSVLETPTPPPPP